MKATSQWRQMIARCYDPDHPKYASYGGRGIRVCDRWICFRLFLHDMGERPEGMTLNRIDNDGPYSPENCEWADHTTQQQNRTNNRKLTLNGETLCITEWARRLGVTREALRNRVLRGWTDEDALQIPFRSQQ